MKEMSQLYARVFLQILDSSIAEDFNVRHVFEDFLKLADHKTGVVDMTREALHRRLNVPPDVLNKAIDVLESPDPKSRDPEYDGRRIIRLDSHRDWGWLIVNWTKYGDLRTKADVSSRVAKFRAKKKMEIDRSKLVEFPPHLATQQVLDRWETWMSARLQGKKVADFERLFNEQIKWLSQFKEKQVLEIIGTSLRNGWQGLFEPKQPIIQRQQPPVGERPGDVCY